MTIVKGRITTDRVLWAHRCHEDHAQCTEPEAHFHGSDAEWDLFVRIARGQYAYHPDEVPLD